MSARPMRSRWYSSTRTWPPPADSSLRCCSRVFWFGKADLTMALNGALAGLVAITAEPLTPTPLLATTIGIIGGLLVVPSIIFMDRWFKIDDPVGAHLGARHRRHLGTAGRLPVEPGCQPV